MRFNAFSLSPVFEVYKTCPPKRISDEQTVFGDWDSRESQAQLISGATWVLVFFPENY